MNDIAVFGPFVIPGTTGCYECTNLHSDNKNLPTEIIKEDIIKLSSISYQAPSYGPLNSIAASLACLDILSFLGKFGVIRTLNKRIGIHMDSLEKEYQHCHKKENCLVCKNLNI